VFLESAIIHLKKIIGSHFNPGGYCEVAPEKNNPHIKRDCILPHKPQVVAIKLIRKQKNQRVDNSGCSGSGYFIR
jgi:hypothetical protein